MFQSLQTWKYSGLTPVSYQVTGGTKDRPRKLVRKLFCEPIHERFRIVSTPVPTGVTKGNPHMHHGLMLSFVNPGGKSGTWSISRTNSRTFCEWCETALPEVYTDCILAKKHEENIAYEQWASAFLWTFSNRRIAWFAVRKLRGAKSQEKTRIYTMGFCIPRDAKHANHSFFALHTESVLIPNLLGEGLQTFLVRRPLEPKCFFFCTRNPF